MQNWCNVCKVTEQHMLVHSGHFHNISGKITLLLEIISRAIMKAKCAHSG